MNEQKRDILDFTFFYFFFYRFKMGVLKIRFEEGSYEGEVGDTKIPNGEGIFEFRWVTGPW